MGEARVVSLEIELLVGPILWNLDRLNEAENLLLTRTDQPDSGVFYLAPAQLLLAKGRKEEARADIERTIELEPRNWRVWHMFINHLERKVEDNQALENVRKIGI